MEAQNLFRIRAGALALFASGVLTAVGLYFRGPILDPAVHTEAFMQAAVSPNHFIAQLILLPNLVIQLYGFLGLYAFLAHTSVDRSAFVGAALCIAANGFFLPFAGIIAFVSPPVGSLYLQGQTEVIEIFNTALGGAFAAPFLVGSAWLLLLGALFLSIAIWRSDSLPRWSALPFFFHSIGIGLAAPFSYAMEYTGALLLLVSATWIAWSIWQQTGKGLQ